MLLVQQIIRSRQFLSGLLCLSVVVFLIYNNVEMERSIRRETTGRGDYNDINIVDNIPQDIKSNSYTTRTSLRTNDTLVSQEATDFFIKDTSSPTNIPIIATLINNPKLEWTKYVSII